MNTRGSITKIANRIEQGAVQARQEGLLLPYGPQQPEWEAALRPAIKAYSSWDMQSAVRSKPLPDLLEEEVKEQGKLFYSPGEAPIIAHPLIAQLGPVAIQKVLGLLLNQNTAFTQSIEDNVVIPVANQLANRQFDVVLPFDLCWLARHVAVDEAEHSRFTFWLESRACRLTGIPPLATASQAFLQSLDAICRRSPARYRDLIRLLFTICSETLITGSLASLHQDERVVTGVREMFRNHAADEARHSALFGAALDIVWPQLTKAQQRFLGPLLPEFIAIFLRPDFAALQAGLESLALGLTPAEIGQLLRETYTPERVGEMARTAAKPSLHILRNKGLFKDTRTHEAFLSSGLLTE